MPGGRASQAFVLQSDGSYAPLTAGALGPSGSNVYAPIKEDFYPSPGAVPQGRPAQAWVLQTDGSYAPNVAGGGGGGGSGTVTSVSAGSSDIVIGGTPTVTPTVDLSATVKTDLGLAASSVQSVGAGSADVVIGGTGTAPTVDLSATVKTELGLAASSVQSVAAGDTSIVVGGTATAPTVETGTLDVIATDHPPAGNWSNNSHKITALANGTVTSDAATFGQASGSASVTASGNAATVATATRSTLVTNNSAATLTITISTTGAAAQQPLIVQILDFSGVAQTLTWVNTENSTVSVPTTSNGSTTLPLTVGFIWNAATSKWRCVAVA